MGETDAGAFIWQCRVQYLNSVQVPFEAAVKDPLGKIAKGEYKTPDSGKRKFGAIVFAAISLPNQRSA